MQATAKDLRFYTKELLATVDRGEEVIITFRGKPCAKLVPINEEESDVIQPNSLFGMWKNNAEVEDVKKYMRTIRKGRFDVD
ncbi:MAG: type II toxin-antitoxin system prevent-host-death family antitoxin [Proteobacteria bacterium]|nr:type II toxin-antitoxin system prevent-host-death family antitoxin [Pseudomonadota bacterium]